MPESFEGFDLVLMFGRHSKALKWSLQLLPQGAEQFGWIGGFGQVIELVRELLSLEQTQRSSFWRP